MAVVTPQEEEQGNQGAPALTGNQGTAATQGQTGTNSGIVSTSEAAGGVGGKGAPNAGVTSVQNANPNAPTATQQSEGAGGFQNLSDYLNANQSGANNLGDRVTGTINTAVNEGASGIQSAGANFGADVTKGTTQWDPSLIATATANPQDFLNNSTEMQQLATMRAGQYQGPNTWAGSSQDQQALAAQQEAQQTAQLGQTSAGRSQLLEQSAASPYTAGENALNQGLIQNTSSAINPIIQASNAGANLGGTYAQTGQNAQQAVTQGQNTSTATGTQTTGALNQAVTDYQKQIDAEVSKANADALAQQQATAAALQQAQSTQSGTSGTNAASGAPTSATQQIPAGVTSQEIVAKLTTAQKTQINTLQGQINALQSQIKSIPTTGPHAGMIPENTGDGGGKGGGRVIWTKADPAKLQSDLSALQDQQNQIIYTVANSIKPPTPVTAAAGGRYVMGPGGAMIHIPAIALGPTATATQGGATSKATAQSATTTPTTTGPQAPLKTTLDDTTLKSMGITAAQWAQLVALQNQAIQYGGGINAANYLQTTAPQLEAGNVLTQAQQNQYSALNTLAGNTNPASLGGTGATGSQTFNISGAVDALNAQIAAGKSNVQQTTAAQAAQAAAAQSHSDAQNTQTEVGVVGGAIAGAEIGSSFGPIGTVVGAVVGAIVGLFSCFAAGTKIKIDHNVWRNVEDIHLGDRIYYGGYVFQTGKGLTTELYNYKGVRIAGGHTVQEDGKWLHVRDSKLAEKIDLNGGVEVVYFLSTEHSRIVLDGFLATDWMETLDDKLVTRQEDERVEWLNKKTEE